MSVTIITDTISERRAKMERINTEEQRELIIEYEIDDDLVDDLLDKQRIN